MGIKSKSGLLGCMIFIVLVSCTSCGYFSGRYERVPILLEDREIEFETEKVIKKDIINLIRVDGVVFSKNTQILKFGNPGKLGSCDAYVGKRVKKGDILATLDVGYLQEQIEIEKLKVEQAEIRVEIAEESGDLRKIKDAKIAKRIQEIELGKLESSMMETSLIADIDGIIIQSILRNIGSEIVTNVTMAVIMDTSDIGVKFKPHKTQLNQITIGDNVKLNIEDKTYESEIIYKFGEYLVAKIPEDIVGNLKVSKKIGVEKLLKKVEGAILAPKTGVSIDYLGRSTVQTIVDGKIIVKEVQIGIESEGYYEILDGLEEGEAIIVK